MSQRHLENWGQIKVFYNIRKYCDLNPINRANYREVIRKYEEKLALFMVITPNAWTLKKHRVIGEGALWIDLKINHIRSREVSLI